jgi:hypothetical protein
MAKSTQHKALASLGFKLRAAAEKYSKLKGSADALLTRNYQLTQSRDAAQQAADKYFVERNEARRERDVLKTEMETRRVVPSMQYIRKTEELARANEQVANLQNRNAALRNELGDVKSSAWVYGVLVATAAYLAGMAMQHWFPVNL